MSWAVSGHVFISYRHGPETEYVERLAAFLTSAGVPVWFDREIVTGDRWDQLIRTQVDGCAAFVVIMTPEAEQARWVAREITQAENRNRPIFPLLLLGEAFFRLNDLQFEDVRRGQMPGSEFVRRLQSLVSAHPVAVLTPEPLAQYRVARTPGDGDFRGADPGASSSHGAAHVVHAPAPTKHHRPDLSSSAASGELSGRPTPGTAPPPERLRRATAPAVWKWIGRITLWVSTLFCMAGETVFVVLTLTRSGKGMSTGDYVDGTLCYGIPLVILGAVTIVDARRLLRTRRALPGMSRARNLRE